MPLWILQTLQECWTFLIQCLYQAHNSIMLQHVKKILLEQSPNYFGTKNKMELALILRAPEQSHRSYMSKIVHKCKTCAPKPGRGPLVDAFCGQKVTVTDR